MTAGAPIRVLVVDDQRVVRDGLAMLLGMADDLEVVGSASDGEEAMDLAAALRPDVVLMDLRMPGIGGVGATAAIRAAGHGAVVVLTTYVDDESLFPALRAGAAGYLTKDATAEQIEAAIRAVRAGGTWLDPVVQRRLIEVVAAPPPVAVPDVAVLPDGLTNREAEVLGLVAEGLSNEEIGRQLFLGRATVKTHVNHIFAKTGCRDRAQAVRYAYRTGLASPRD